jgi:16S rRNA (cytosine1402-N4)-methyltransferase
MDTDAPLAAYDVINTYPEKDLRRIIQEYGEERFAAKIAKRIVEARSSAPILSTVSLAEIIRDSIPAAARQNGPHPAKRTFQAIRIEVNGELGIIEPTIRTVARHLVSGGRIAIISFHSLEDRPVKQTYTSLAEGCTCPVDFPVCVCGKKPTLKILTKKPILPSEIELEQNPRSRSAKLRVAEKT